MDSPLVQKRSIATAKIDQPKLADILQVNKRVPARHLRRFQHDRVSTGPSKRTTAFDGMPSVIGCFQPGTFRWGYVHAETVYQMWWSTQSGLTDERRDEPKPKLDTRCRSSASGF